MGQVYEPWYNENGGVPDPAFYVQNMATFAAEANSGIDRDNMPANTIASGDIDTSGGKVFNLVSGNHFNATNTTYTPDQRITSWQGGAGTGASGIGLLDFTLAQDAQLDVMWSGTWSWNGAYSWVTAGTRPDRTDTFDTVQIRVTVDGVEILRLGPFEDGMQYGSAYGCGCIQLPAGVHSLSVECLMVRTIAQTGELSGSCTNAVAFGPRTILALGRIR